jgi:hypothetical protein
LKKYKGADSRVTTAFDYGRDNENLKCTDAYLQLEEASREASIHSAIRQGVLNASYLFVVTIAGDEAAKNGKLSS